VSDERLVVSPEELERLAALQPSASDTQYARVFASVAKALDNCQHDGQVTLLLSTCRNEHLTINAIFTDLKMCVSRRSGGVSLFDRFVAAVGNSTMASKTAKEARGELGLLLSQARVKRKVWDEREALWAEYEEAANRVPDIIGRRDARSVLTSAQPIPHDDGTWPGNYTRMSKDETRFHDKLDLLADVTANLSAVYELLGGIADLNTNPAGNVSLFDDEVPQGPLMVDWSGVIASAEGRGVWYRSSGPAGGAKFSHKNLPPQDEGWSPEGATKNVELLAGTQPGKDTDDQIAAALRFAQTGIAHARFLLQRAFAANVARLPMPQPFLIDLTPREPVARSETAPRSFRRNITQVVEGDRRGDTTRIAVLRVAVPEAWHNHERFYRYNADITDIGAITSLIEDAVAAAAEAEARFLFLPECFIPRAAVKVAKAAAGRAGLNLIGGLEAHIDDPGRTVNEALLWFPDAVAEDPEVSGLQLLQGKQGPSIFEVGRPHFAQDARLNVVRNTLLGSLGVVLCSDYLEADLMSALSVAEAPRLHALVVIARNPSQSVFTALAQADAIRLYSHVIIVNSTDGSERQLTPSPDGGCLVAAPRGRGPLTANTRVPLSALPGTPEGFQPPELLIWDLDVAGIHGRNNRGDQSGWLKASTFAKKG
jgi:hypothetical protein